MTDQERLEFLAERRTGLGSTDAAAILGLSPWKTPLHVFLEKTGELSDTDDAPKRWGRLLEDVVATAYEEQSGRTLHLPLTRTLRHQQYPWMIASLDRLTIVNDGFRVVELKTARTDQGWEEEGSDRIPDQYFIQVQHQMCVTDTQTADVAVLIAGSDFRIYTVPRHEAIIERLLSVLSDFWHHHILPKKAPDPNWEHPATAALVKDLYPVDEHKEIDLGPEVEDLLRIFCRAKVAEQEARRVKEEAKSKLLFAMGDAATACCPDGTQLIRKIIKRKAYTVEPVEYVDFRIRSSK